MTANDRLTDEERPIVLFLESYFEQHGMSGALAMLKNAETKPYDLRAVIDGYRELYQRRSNRFLSHKRNSDE